MSRLAILAVILAAGCSPPKADLRPLVAVAAKYSLLDVPPAPSNPTGKCRSCGGSGKVGDGRVAVTCGRCNGSGVEPKADCKDGRCATSR